MFSSLMAGCTTDNDAIVTEPSGLSFEVRTRTTETTSIAPDDNSQYTRLYIAERMAEHDGDHLHCGATQRHTLTGGTYSQEKLFGQWYKFAFVCVPKWGSGGGDALLTEKDPAEQTCDYNKLLIDFEPVLTYQKQYVNIAETQDLNIYRKVIDRWIDPDSENIENVEMTRMTGELLIDMGIPADQFPKEVKSITLTLEYPMIRAYIRDETRDEVISEQYYGDMVYTLDFSKLSDEEYAAAMKQKQQFHLCLLPEVLKGRIVIAYKNSNEAVSLPIGEKTENGDTHIEVRKNRRTTVLYNGMQNTEFEVRYAGFDTGNDSTVGVDDDEWDGWQNPVNMN